MSDHFTDTIAEVLDDAKAEAKRTADRQITSGTYPYRSKAAIRRQERAELVIAGLRRRGYVIVELSLRDLPA